MFSFLVSEYKETYVDSSSLFIDIWLGIFNSSSLEGISLELLIVCKNRDLIMIDYLKCLYRIDKKKDKIL